MKRIILSVVGLLVGAGIIRAEDFPAEQIWELSFEDTATCLGSSWTENNEACALIGTNSRLHMVRNGEIVWSSRDIGSVCGAGWVEFEDGVSLIGATTNNSEEIVLGVVHRFYGDGFDEYASGTFTGLNEAMSQYGYDCVAKFIFQSMSLQDDSLKTIFLWCKTYYTDMDILLNSETISGGVIHTFSLDSMALVGGRSRITGYSPGSFNVADVSGDEQNELILGGNSFYSSYRHNSDVTWIRYGGGVTIWDPESGQVIDHPLVSSSGNYGPDWPWVPWAGIGGVTVTESGELIASILKDYPDSSIAGFGVYSLPEMEQTAWHSRPSSYHLLGTITEDDNEKYLIGITNQSHITVFHLPDFRVVYDDPFLRTPLFGAVLKDFDGDLSEDILILAGNTLSLFSIGSLGIQSSEVIPHPSSFILSAFPNPFNSSTTINYSLPSPGRYAIDVVDIQGRLVTRLSDGWREAGSYKTLWNAAANPSGAYLIRLDNGIEPRLSPVTLVR